MIANAIASLHNLSLLLVVGWFGEKLYTKGFGLLIAVSDMVTSICSASNPIHKILFAISSTTTISIELFRFKLTHVQTYPIRGAQRLGQPDRTLTGPHWDGFGLSF